MKFLRFVLMLGALAAPAAAGGVPFTSLFVFGDSNSDNGRRLLLQEGDKPASPPYFFGRHSNGPVAAEHLATGLGLSGSQFVDYAVGGALSGHGNVDLDPRLAGTGLLDQLATFQATHAAADPGALYFIYGGDNDINECIPSCDPAELQAVVSNLGSLVQSLTVMGARYFMVVGSYGGAPEKGAFRSLLQPALADLDALLPASITYFNARPVLQSMTAAANPYGFSNRLSTAPCYTGDLTGAGGTECVDPETYVFWDLRGHLTAPAHEILGAAMLAAAPERVPLPSTLVLLALALAALSACAVQPPRRAHARHPSWPRSNRVSWCPGTLGSKAYGCAPWR